MCKAGEFADSTLVVPRRLPKQSDASAADVPLSLVANVIYQEVWLFEKIVLIKLEIKLKTLSDFKCNGEMSLTESK